MTKLKELRTLNKLTLLQLSKQTNIVVSTLSSIETGKRKITMEQAIICANYFNVSVDYLLGTTFSNRLNTFIQDCQRDYKNIIAKDNEDNPVLTELKFKNYADYLRLSIIEMLPYLDEKELSQVEEMLSQIKLKKENE